MEGVSKRTYTDEQLKNIDPPPFEYQGKKYTAYEATQKQRQIETAMRKCKREIIGYEAAGLTEEYQASAIKLRRLSAEYKNFSKAAGLREQPERARVLGFGNKEAAKARGGIEKYARVRYHKSGEVVVTDDWTKMEHPRLPQRYLENAVVDTISRNGTQRERTFYDQSGRQIRQVSNGPHGNLKRHPYGANGEHAHDIIWKDGKIVGRPARELTDSERKESADIL